MRHMVVVADMARRRTKVAVFLDAGEAEFLDAVRGPIGRGKAFRLLLTTGLPPKIPEINQKLAADLGRALGNLASLATMSRHGGYIQETELLPALRDLKFLLLTGKADLTGEGWGE